MIKTLMKEIKQYKKDSILTIVFASIEVFMEILVNKNKILLIILCELSKFYSFLTSYARVNLKVYQTNIRE